ncbi:muramidase family protein [Marinilactibacillus piezotolerans]|uniref:muramidase family protein n=1 Tax=Marinilactibacillus piezotolerans TaxID=258723 RepID=UPI0009B07B34|nr:LysM domain-containing protein [Marinilactibacillus piezotolerans]
MMTRQQTVQRKVLRKVKKNWVTVAIAGLIASNLVAPATASAQSWTARTPEEISQDIQGYKTVKDLSTYQIVWGDTLWGLSQASGFSISEFISAFGIQNPNLIYAGNRLGESSVGFTPSRTKSAEGTYKVVYGDTLSSIAASFDTTVERLVSWNNIMNKDLIFPGQVLRVTEDAQVAESATTETEEAQNDVQETTPVTGSEDETETVVEQPVISDDESDQDNVDEEEETESDVETPEDEEETGSDVETPEDEEETGSDVETPAEETPSEPEEETPVEEEDNTEPVKETPTDSEDETDYDDENEPIEEEITRNEAFFNTLRVELGEASEHVRFGDSTFTEEPQWDVKVQLNSVELLGIEGEQNPFPTHEEVREATETIRNYLDAQGYDYFLNEGMVSHVFFIDLDNPKS